MHIAIAGAGIIGLQTAWRLRTRGHRITILDPDPSGGATFAAAGMLAPVSEVQFGQERLYPLLVAAREEYPRLIDELGRATERPLGFLDNGTLLIGGDRADLDRVRDHARVHSEYGLNIQKLSTRDIREREPFLNARLAGGFEAPDDAQVDPRVLCAALRDALSAALDPQDFPNAGPPVTWVTERVTSVDGDPSGPYAVACDGGERLTADRVVIACGTGCAAVAGIPQRTPLDVRPVYGDVLRLRPHPSAASKQLLSSTIRATVLGRQVYLVPRADGEIVVGASVREDGLDGISVGGVHELLEDALTILPAIRDLEIADITARARPASPDDIPLLGLLPDAPGILVSAGYSRHGILLAPLGARLGADLLTGRAPEAADREMLRTMDLGRGGARRAAPSDTHRLEGASDGNSHR
ncbi:glycine oxidase ThiO [Curtobacterium sp. S6]|uniref:glycine oxidase ThiO n=1 Tax=Curtobacterium sp. S6 TaxID=1479623 RepID=UPI00068E5085|nr:glycine oxidase ThiO [Curtobacterium sp. S6]